MHYALSLGLRDIFSSLCDICWQIALLISSAVTAVNVPPYVQCVMESATVSMAVTKQTAVSVFT